MKEILTILLCSLFITASAQTNTSPYSIVGIGDIEPGYNDHGTGMADASVSLSSPRYIYNANPASLGSLDEHFYSFELGTRFKGVKYSGKYVSLTSNSSTDLQFSRLAMAIKIKKFWGASVGLAPYSSSNYSFYNDKYIVGTTTSVNTHYTGTGGLNQFYFANGFRINKHLSIGVQASVLFGSLMQNEVLNTTLTTDSITTTRDLYLSKLLPKAGIQYHTKISKNLQLNLGAAATAKASLNANYALTVQEGSTVLVNDSTIKQSYFAMPLNYTAGASLVYKNAFTLSADYQAQKWGDVQYKGLGYSLTNSNRISAGVQYTQQGKYYNYTYDKYYLQAGGYYSNSYLVVNGYQLKDAGFTLGAGATTKIGLGSR